MGQTQSQQTNNIDLRAIYKSTTGTNKKTTGTNQFFI